MWGHDLPELFLKGGWVMWPLLACSIIGLAIILERGLVIAWKAASFERVAARVQALLRRRGALDAGSELLGWRSPVARVAGVYLKHADSPAELRAEVVGREASRQLTALESRMTALAMIAQVAPLLGLLGTVIGLVDAFYRIEAKAGQVQPGDLAAGIWIALLTTVFGLVIAVPCQVAFTLLDRRIQLTQMHMEWITSCLDEWLSLHTGERPALEPTPLPAPVSALKV